MRQVKRSVTYFQYQGDLTIRQVSDQMGLGISQGTIVPGVMLESLLNLVAGCWYTV